MDREGRLFLEDIPPGKVKIELKEGCEGKQKNVENREGDKEEKEFSYMLSTISLSDSEILIFPLPFRPKESYLEPPRAFGSPRDGNKRLHAGCDLYAPLGTEILALKDGVIIDKTKNFYKDTGAIAIDHGNFIVRYCEIKNEVIEGIEIGNRVKAGQIIAHVGKIQGEEISMLHLEAYTKYDNYGNKVIPPFRDNSKPKYYRRSGLADPTEILNKAKLKIEGEQI